MFDFSLSEAMNQPFLVDITVTFPDKHIDCAVVVGRPATFKIDVRANVPSVIDPVQGTARTLLGIVKRWT